MVRPRRWTVTVQLRVKEASGGSLPGIKGLSELSSQYTNSESSRDSSSGKRCSINGEAVSDAAAHAED